MNKRIYSILFILFTGLFFIIIYSMGFLNSGENGKTHFEIYLVKDTDAFESGKKELTDLVLADTPIVTEKNLVSYNWKTHSFELKKDVILTNLEKNRNIAAYTPFVVVAKGERVYLGAFYSPVTSVSPPQNIQVFCGIWNFENKPKTYNLDKWGDAVGDPRNDKRIYEVLKEAGKLVE